MSKLRCIGGPSHGEKIPCSGSTVAVPVRQDALSACIHDEFTYHSTFKIAHYRRHMVGFGNTSRLTVLRYEGMSDEEFWRRVADLVEGV